jgi:hypothetical protein
LVRENKKKIRIKKLLDQEQLVLRELYERSAKVLNFLLLVLNITQLSGHDYVRDCL